jgi:LytS/YehU family sensor histidine kinase
MNSEGDDPDIARQGLENVRKRLDMLYPSDHKMSVNLNDEISNISLELTLTDAITLPQNISLIRNRSYEMEMPVGG